MEALNTVTNEEGNPHGVRACLFNPGAGHTPIMKRRPVEPSQEAKTKMIQSEDIAATVVFLASLPPRVHIDFLSMMPTELGGACRMNPLAVFTKPGESVDAAGPGAAYSVAGLRWIELPVRPGFQVEPDAIERDLPAAVKLLGEHGIRVLNVRLKCAG